MFKTDAINLVDVANNFVGEKGKQEAAFWQIVNEGCPQKGVVFDEIDTNCGIVNRVSIYVYECVC